MILHYSGRNEDSLLNNKPENDRLLPAIMIWGAGLGMDQIKVPENNIWVGAGKNPVALMRTSWSDPNAIYVGMKGGSPSVNHGHMDVGSFVLDAGGERWAMDFGMQNYNSLETAGVNLWAMGQNSQRWEIYRYNNFVHNTLTINNQLQKVDGYAPIVSWSDRPDMINAITDITSVYKGILDKAIRGIAIINKQYVTVRDEIETSDSSAVIRWTLLTSASVKSIKNNEVVLMKNGKTLTVRVKEPSTAKIQTWSTIPPHTYDAPNPGTILIGFETTVPANTKTSLTVELLPGGAKDETSPEIKTLKGWPVSHATK